MASGDSTSSMSFCVGRPVISRILSIWLRVEEPGKIALPVMSSPMMQPTDHISTALEYFVDPSNISGALYHLVATYSVKTGGPSSSLVAIDLASPKSANLH